LSPPLLLVTPLAACGAVDPWPLRVGDFAKTMRARIVSTDTTSGASEPEEKDRPRP